MNDITLAWRNLWRNKRRTLITAASVFFAIFFALVMRSFQLGAYDRLFRNIIESYTGYLQIQQRDYFDEPVLDNGFVPDTGTLEKIKKDANVSTVVPRLESFALAAVESRTQGVLVMGVDPEKEDQVSGIRNRMVKFRLDPAAIRNLKAEVIPERMKKLLDLFVNESYASTARLMMDMNMRNADTASLLPLFRKHASFTNHFMDKADSTGVIIGDGLAGYLKVKTGDTLVLIGQGYHSSTAAGKFLIRGILKLPAPDIDNRIVYMPIATAGELFAAPGLITSAVICLHQNDDESLQETTDRLSHILPDPLVTRSWKEMNALLINQIEADRRSGAIMIEILYLVIAFGIFGTVLMMLAERRREFGMLISVGMQKRKLATIFSLEMLFTGFLGIVAGVVASLPVVFYGYFNPIRFRGQMGKMYEDYGFDPVMPTLLPDTYYIWQIVVVLIILAVTILYSVRKIYRLNPIQAMRA